jgi:hypothetical protein
MGFLTKFVTERASQMIKKSNIRLSSGASRSVLGRTRGNEFREQDRSRNRDSTLRRTIYGS